MKQFEFRSGETRRSPKTSDDLDRSCVMFGALVGNFNDCGPRHCLRVLKC